MTTAQLADATELHRSYLSRLERGLTGARLDTIHRIAAELGVDPGEIARSDEPSEHSGVPYPGTPEGAYWTYTPEQAERYLPWSARSLRRRANAREIPHNQGGGRITFTGRDICEISDMSAVRPLHEQQTGAARAA